MRRSSGDALSLAMPVLAAASDEAIGSATLSFLVQRALEVEAAGAGPGVLGAPGRSCGAPLGPAGVQAKRAD